MVVVAMAVVVLVLVVAVMCVCVFGVGLEVVVAELFLMTLEVTEVAVTTLSKPLETGSQRYCL